MAQGQSIPVIPPKPALQMIISRCGVVLRSFAENVSIELREVRSSCSGCKVTRVDNGSSNFCDWR